MPKSPKMKSSASKTLRGRYKAWLTANAVMPNSRLAPSDTALPHDHIKYAGQVQIDLAHRRP
jgi:hypothetical protein